MSKQNRTGKQKDAYRRKKKAKDRREWSEYCDSLELHWPDGETTHADLRKDGTFIPSERIILPMQGDEASKDNSPRDPRSWGYRFVTSRR